MKPPICAVCDLDFRDDLGAGGSVEFKLSDEDKKYNARLEETGMVGHPAGEEWFCSKHLEAADQLKNKTLAEALKRLKQKIR